MRYARLALRALVAWSASLYLTVALPAQAAPATAAAPGAPAAATNAAPAPPAGTPSATYTLARASWLADRVPLRVGEILTVVVDERTRSSERVQTNASNARSQRMGLNVGVAGANAVGPTREFGAGNDAQSRDAADALRNGDLTAVLTVRVTELDEVGNAKVQGTKVVTIDGRKQELELEGVIHADDVTAQRQVSSARIADAVISYKGKKMGPRQGILGKILQILWP